MVAGVNGAGKTTSIAKLAHLFIVEGKKVVLGAADTFRAAAVEQLTIWAGRLGAEIVTGEPGSDPASVAHRAVARAIESQADVCIVDTAGRLQTQQNLMQQLTKIHRVIGKQIPEAPHEVLLVLDATTGQNGISQAKHFTDAVHCTGIVLAKLDGTAKGGVVVAIRQQVGLPVKYIGVGEKAEDLALFEPDDFVEALFDDLAGHGAPASRLKSLPARRDRCIRQGRRRRRRGRFCRSNAVFASIGGSGAGERTFRYSRKPSQTAASFRAVAAAIMRSFASIRFKRHVDSSIAEPTWSLGGLRSSTPARIVRISPHGVCRRHSPCAFNGLENWI